MKALKSILYSLFQTLLRLDIRDSIPGMFTAAHGIVRALWHDGEHPELKALRDLTCQRCPMYSEKWETCGVPGEVQEEITAPDGFYYRPKKIGCWCYLPLANNDPEKDCWARAKGLEVGWPDELRPKA